MAEIKGSTEWGCVMNYLCPLFGVCLAGCLTMCSVRTRVLRFWISRAVVSKTNDFADVERVVLSNLSAIFRTVYCQVQSPHEVTVWSIFQYLVQLPQYHEYQNDAYIWFCSLIKVCFDLGACLLIVTTVHPVKCVWRGGGSSVLLVRREQDVTVRKQECYPNHRAMFSLPVTGCV